MKIKRIANIHYEYKWGGQEYAYEITSYRDKKRCV